MDIRVERLTPELMDAYFDFFDNRAFTDGSPYRCYCQCYQLSPEEERNLKKEKLGDLGKLSKSIAKQQIESGRLCGYLAFVDGKAIGWCNVNEKNAYTVLSREIPEITKIGYGVGRVVACFEVAPDYRGKGVATALLQYALKDSKSHGFVSMEAYPEVREKRNEWDSRGPLRLYEKLDFYMVAKNDKYYVMRMDLLNM